MSWQVLSGYTPIPFKYEKDARLFIEKMKYITEENLLIFPPYTDDTPLSELLTIIITSSPIPSNPSMEIIEEVMASIQEYKDISDCKIIVTCDGYTDDMGEIMPMYKSGWKDYEYFMAEVDHFSKTKKNFRNVTTLYGKQWIHQTNTIRRAIEITTTPLVFIVEHDWKLFGNIDFRGMIRILSLFGEKYKCIRLSMNDRILDKDGHIPPVYGEPPEQPGWMLLDHKPIDYDGVPMVRNCVWSCWPHLASLATYKYYMTLSGRRSITHIENVLYGIVHNQCLNNIEAYDKWKTYMYAPGTAVGGNARVVHLHGRGKFKDKILEGDIAPLKLQCHFSYDNFMVNEAPFPPGSDILCTFCNNLICKSKNNEE